MNLEKRIYLPLTVLILGIVISIFLYNSEVSVSKSPDSSTICRCRISDVHGLPKGFNVINSPTSEEGARNIRKNHNRGRTFGDMEDTVVGSSDCDSLNICDEERECRVKFTIYNANAPQGASQIRDVLKSGTCYEI